MPRPSPRARRHRRRVLGAIRRRRLCAPRTRHPRLHRRLRPMARSLHRPECRLRLLLLSWHPRPRGPARTHRPDPRGGPRTRPGATVGSPCASSCPASAANVGVDGEMGRDRLVGTRERVRYPTV